MVGVLGVVLVVAAIMVIVAVVYFTLILNRGRRLGTSGFTQRSRLTCPKCGESFDYDWVPGVSFSAIRLGTSRYFACPSCHKWSLFNIYNTMVARPADGGTTPPTR